MALIAETSNPSLELALMTMLKHRQDSGGTMGELAPVAVRLGLLQNTLRPRFLDPQLVLFAADHGLAVEGLSQRLAGRTEDTVAGLLAGHSALPVFARQSGLALTLVDCGMASPLQAQDGLLLRKIAHGTRNARRGPAMTVAQAQAAIRAGMEIGGALPGNAVACAGLGLGGDETAALLLSSLTGTPVHELLGVPAQPAAQDLHRLAVVQGALARHRALTDPVEVLAAFGGFETAVMAGVMLVAASKRHLVLVDGLTACAALLVAARISPPVTDYCVFCRSTPHPGLDRALALFHTSPMLNLGLDTLDGTGACLTWPLVRSAAALLGEVTDSASLRTAAADPAAHWQQRQGSA